MTLTIIAAIALVISSLADALTTIKALQRGAVETNPIIKFLMDKVGLFWVPIKLIPAGTLLYAAYLYPHDERLMLLCAVLSTVTSLIAIRNSRLERDK